MTVGARHTGSRIFETGGWITKDGAINKKQTVSGDCESDDVDVGVQNRKAGIVQVMNQDIYEQKPARDSNGSGTELKKRRKKMDYRSRNPTLLSKTKM